MNAGFQSALETWLGTKSWFDSQQPNQSSQQSAKYRYKWTDAITRCRSLPYYFGQGAWAGTLTRTTGRGPNVDPDSDLALAKGVVKTLRQANKVRCGWCEGVAHTHEECVGLTHCLNDLAEKGVDRDQAK